MEKKASYLAVFQYLLLNIPWWIIQVLPVAVLLAVLFSLGQLAKQNEITALKAAGINPWRIMGMLLLCGLVIGAGELVLREKVIPFTIRQAEIIRKEKIEKVPRTIETDFYNIVVSVPPHGRMTIGWLSTKDNTIHKTVIDYYDNDFNLKEQVVADSGQWQNNGWVLTGGVRRTFIPGSWQDSRFDSMPVHLPFKPQDFVFIVSKLRPEQMSAGEFKQYIKRLQTVGIPVEKERIQYNLRWSSVFSHLIVMLIGIPFAVGLGSKHGKVISFTFALIFAFVYWGFQAIGQSLGENRVISPWLAAWLGNIVFGAIGLGLVSKIKR